VALQTETLPRLDDVRYALQPLVSHFTRSHRHRCLKSYGISRLPKVEKKAKALKMGKMSNGPAATSPWGRRTSSPPPSSLARRKP
jgi:hypothetical protein